MKRREFMALLGGAAAAWPLVAAAQQAKPVIGFLHSGSARSFAPQVAAFRNGLEEGGFVEDRDVTIEYRWAEGRFDRLPAMAAELARQPVNVIAALGGNASNLAGKAVAESVPVVFVSGSDPIRSGLVTDLGRPTGNMTGVSFFIADLVAKKLGLLQQMLPGTTSVTLLVNPNSPEARLEQADAPEAARKLGIKLVVLQASTPDEIDRALAQLPQMQAGALLVGADPFFGSRVEQIVTQVERYRTPAMYYRREYVSAGGLMSYGTSIMDAYRQGGIYVARVLKGAKPAELPIVQASKFEFVINLNTAKSLGLVFHPQLLATADEVIE
jgi:putative ABC transport system substrate-binding protein